MENTLENKAKFFAQYWGQEVHAMKMSKKDVVTTIDAISFDKDLSKDYLLLKPLSSITDEDAKQITKISISDNPMSTITIKRVGYGAEITNVSPNSTWTLVLTGIDIYFRCFDSRAENDSSLVLAVYDYLRSKGYALPYMGVNVEKFMGYGWINLT